MFFNNGSLESSNKKLLVGCFLLAGLVLKYWASLWDLLFWQLRSVVRQIRFEVTGVTGFFACVPIMVSFVHVFEREIVGWLVSVGQVRLAIVSFALTRAQLKTVVNFEANWFWINWLLRMFFNNGSLESSSKKLLVGCFLLAGLVLKYWASPGYMLYWQLRSVLRQTRFEVTGLCALFPIMVSIVCGLEREIVGWLFSVGQVSLAILSFALRLALLTAEIRCETNSFRSNWFIRLCSDNGFIRSRFRARNCWLACFSWPGYPRNSELRFNTCSVENCDELWGKLVLNQLVVAYVFQ